MKISMMLHFATTASAYPEPYRRSRAYVKFVRQLLANEMIERPSNAERYAHPGWAYRATPKGWAFVNALKAIPEPRTYITHVVELPVTC
jgi:hypothetical protein